MGVSILSEERQQILETLRTQPDISVLIIGGGINGAGLFRELALQGIDVLLIDKADFCAGASAASSHMIHGGLRYLENGEFGLVKESLKERNLLLQNAPHYVHPLPTTIPIFQWLAGLINGARSFVKLPGRPGRRGALLIKVGLTLYDLFTRSQRVLPVHHFQSRSASLAERPQLNPNIICTATYYDAWINYPERLCLELILDAESSTPRACALNYVRAQQAHKNSVTLHDQISGEAFVVWPKIVINATGAWIDLTNRAMQQRTQFIGGTKGSHLIIDHPELLAATRGQMLYYENGDGRICILFPIHDKVLVGSTDIPIDDPEAARCEEEEVNYILESVRQVFPAITIDRSQILFRYCGVRPLPASNAGSPGQISRNHACTRITPGNGVTFPIYALIGGKWTTFRSFAEQAADQILQALNRQRNIHSEHIAIGGGNAYPQTPDQQKQWLLAVQQQTQLPIERLKVLLERYGTRAAELAVFIAAEVDTPLWNLADYSRREIEFLLRHERVLHLDDLVLRRTSIALLGNLTQPLLEELAEISAVVLGWSPTTTKQELERTVVLLHDNHGVALYTRMRSFA